MQLLDSPSVSFFRSCLTIVSGTAYGACEKPMRVDATPASVFAAHSRDYTWSSSPELCKALVTASSARHQADTCIAAKVAGPAYL